MENFPPNSQKAAAARSAPPEPKRVERVTTAEVERRKKGVGRKFKEAFIVGDARMAWEYIIMEVIIPSIQDTVIDAFQGGIERLIKGEGARSRRSSYRPWWGQGGYDPNPYGHVDYTAPSRSPQPGSRPAGPPQRQLSRMSRARNEFDEIIIPDRRGAEEVIERMFDILQKYGSVSVADLYELTGLASTHTDVKWGWTQLRGARADRLPKGGFVLNLPEPQPLG